jgi:FMN phosphatase YigB (HAD superfamily)
VIRAVLFDLDDTLVDHQHASRAAIAGVRERFTALRSRELDDLVRENQRILDSMHHDVATRQARRGRRAHRALPPPLRVRGHGAGACIRRAELHRRCITEAASASRARSSS